MTANKKNTSKTNKSPTPATKPAKAAKPKAQPAVEAVTPTASPTPAGSSTLVASITPENVAPVLTSPRVAAAAAMVSTTSIANTPVVVRAVTPVPSKPLLTTITARINVGFGNSLYLRGEGAGLSWSRGVQMSCVGPSEWLITLPESSRPVAFKFLINDVTWSTGQDYSVIPGTSTVLSPSF